MIITKKYLCCAGINIKIANFITRNYTIYGNIWEMDMRAKWILATFGLVAAAAAQAQSPQDIASQKPALA